MNALQTESPASPTSPKSGRRISVIPVNISGLNVRMGAALEAAPEDESVMSPAANVPGPAASRRLRVPAANTPSTPGAVGQRIRRSKTPKTPAGMKSSRNSSTASRRRPRRSQVSDASVASSADGHAATEDRLQRRAEEIFMDYTKEKRQRQETLQRREATVQIRAAEIVQQRLMKAEEGTRQSRTFGNTASKEAVLRAEKTGSLGHFIQEALSERQDQLDGADVAREFWDDIERHIGPPAPDTPRALPWAHTDWVDGHPRILPTAFGDNDDDPPIAPPSPLRSGRLHKAVGVDVVETMSKSNTFGVTMQAAKSSPTPRVSSPSKTFQAQTKKPVPPRMMTSRRTRKQNSQRKRPTDPTAKYRAILKQVGVSETNLEHITPGLPHRLRIEASFLEQHRFGILGRAIPFMHELRELYLSHLLLPQDILNPLIAACGSLEVLEVLDISGNGFGATSVEVLGALLSSKCSVTDLRLQQLKIGDVTLRSLIEDIRGNSLTALDLSQNRIGDREKTFVEDHEPLHQARQNAPNLENLIRASPRLHTLRLTRNRIRYSGSCSLAYALLRKSSLTSLVLDHNPIGDLGSQHIASALRSNTNLRHLDLAYSTVSPMGAFVFKNVLSYYNTTLVELNLSGNHIGKQVLAELVAGVVTRDFSNTVDAFSHPESFFKLHLEQCGDCPALHDLATPPPRQDFDLSVPYERALVLEFMQMAHNQVNSMKLKAVYFDKQAIQHHHAQSQEEEEFSYQPVQLALLHDADAPRSPIRKTSGTDDPAPPRFKRRRKMVEGMVNEGLITISKLAAFFETMQLRVDRALTVYIVDRLNDTVDVHNLDGDKFNETVLDALWIALIDALDGISEYCPAMRPPEPKEKSVDNESSSTKETRKSSAAKTVPAHETTAAALKAKKEAAALEAALELDRLQREAKTKEANEAVLDAEMLKRVFVLIGHPRVSDETLVTRLLWHYSTCTDARNTALTHRRATTNLVGVNRSQVLNHLIETGNFEVDELHMDAAPAMQSGDQLERSSARTGHIRLTELSTLELWSLPFDGYLTLFIKRDNSSLEGADPFFRHEAPESGFRTLLDILGSAEDPDDQAHLLEFVTSSSSTLAYNSTQAAELFSALPNIEMEYRLERILPEMAHYEEAIQVMASLIPHIDDRMQLRLDLGSLWKPTFGLSGGHYHLTLNRDLDRLTAIKLAEVAFRERLESEYYANRGDTSQNGNWENYRNCYYNGRPIPLDVKWFQMMPRTGVVTFDYVSTYRTPSAIKPLSHDEFHSLLGAIHEAIDEFNYNREHEHEAYDLDDGEGSKGESDHGSQHEIRGEGGFADRSPRQSSASNLVSLESKRTLGQLQLSGILADQAKLHYDYIDVSDHLHCSELFKHQVKADVPPAHKRFEAGFVVLCVVEILACGHYFLAEHVAELVIRIPNEQYLRVELIMALLPRIVDPQQLHLVIDHLSERQWHEARYRMGALNLGNCAWALSHRTLRFEVPRCKDDLLMLNLIRHHKFRVKEIYKGVYEVCLPEDDEFERAKHLSSLMKLLEGDHSLRRTILAASAPYRTLRSVRKREYKIKDAIMRVGTVGGMSEDFKEANRSELLMGAQLKAFLEERLKEEAPGMVAQRTRQAYREKYRQHGSTTEHGEQVGTHQLDFKNQNQAGKRRSTDVNKTQPRRRGGQRRPSSKEKREIQKPASRRITLT